MADNTQLNLGIIVPMGGDNYLVVAVNDKVRLTAPVGLTIQVTPALAKAGLTHSTNGRQLTVPKGITIAFAMIADKDMGMWVARPLSATTFAQLSVSSSDEVVKSTAKINALLEKIDLNGELAKVIQAVSESGIGEALAKFYHKMVATMKTVDLDKLMAELKALSSNLDIPAGTTDNED